ncbi:MAG TPA: hypothetical protein VFE47_15105 [Tepidisphaeraceae bacterium]|jgi:hypothetical protein|nr:hypothetical protein [Tepidisphaeraceae bacterium]
MRDFGPPVLIALDPDESHAKYVGRTFDGRQFFVATHADPQCLIHGHVFVAVYLFNSAGKLLEARIDDLGTDSKVNAMVWANAAEQRYRELGWTYIQRIAMQPFHVERFGLAFGLIAFQRDKSDDWMAEIRPGNPMAFFPPWDSGLYDT